ncbi:MAG: DUF1566 domain-containing protein [Proteobacteria bacterium]|nr:DUF1566 domain-containing protein [Pseudomonadota bacterium]
MARFMPKDLVLTFNGATKAVDRLNAARALGHTDWQIPAMDELKILYKNQDRGALKGTFTKAASYKGPSFRFWYWSSTKDRGLSPYAHSLCFADGHEGGLYKDKPRFSCRPIRLEPVK